MCIDPIPVWRSAKKTKNGKDVILFTLKDVPATWSNIHSSFYVPCGKCAGCLSDKRKRWINRLKLEHFSCQDVDTFLTLTYRNAPSSLVKKDCQDFLKRLRNISRDYGYKPFTLRYYLVGEYGSKKGRPHYHALLFGLDLMDEFFQPYIATFKDGYPIYSSKLVEKIWRHGFITIDKVTNQNIKYVSKYILKGDKTHDDLFALHSPKLGASVLFNFKRHQRKQIASLKNPDAYYSQEPLMLPDGDILVPCPIPSAYDRYLEQCEPNLYQIIKAMRVNYAKSRILDRLASANYLKATTKTSIKERPLDYEEITLCNP